MTSERRPLEAVPGLAAPKIPPPPRRPTAASMPASGGDAADESAIGPRAVPVTKPTAPRRAAGMKWVSLSLPISLVGKIKERSQLERISQPSVLLDAISATHDQLGGILAAKTDSVAEVGLFVRRSTSSSEPTATFSVRLLAENVEVIDGLVTQLGAPSRSALCAAALEVYLRPHSGR